MRVMQLGVALAAAVLTGCTASGTLERRIEDELQVRLGPADRYQVMIAGLDAGDGEAEHVQAVGYGIRMRHGPLIDRMQLDLYNVKYDRSVKRLEHADSVLATVWVTTNDLGDYLETIDGVGNATVTVAAPDSASIRVRPEIAGIPLPPGAALDVSGRMVGKGPYLNFEVSEAGAMGLEASEGVVRRISRLINPLVDLSDLPLGLDVSSVAVEGRSVRVDATGDATTLPR